MAEVTSGHIITNSWAQDGKDYSMYLRCDWLLEKQSESDDTSTIYFRLSAKGTNTTAYDYYFGGAFYIAVDGEYIYEEKLSDLRRVIYTDDTIWTVTATVKHDATGKHNLHLSCGGVIYSDNTTAFNSHNVSGFGYFDLPTIDLYPIPTQKQASKTETSITINWTSDRTIDYLWYSTNGGTSWTGVSKSGTSGSYTISGLTAYTKYTVKTRVRAKASQLTADTGSLSITTYNYPYASKMPSFTIGNTLTITLYNPLGRSCTVVLLGADGSQINSSTTSSTSISGYTSTAIQNNLYASIPSAQSGTYQVKVTYGSSTITKTGGTYTINTDDCAPTMGTCSYADTNTTVIAITGNNQNIVRNQSIVKYTAASIAAKKSATLSSCKVVVNGSTYNLTISGTTATGTGSTINSGTDVNAVFTVTDSRGLTASKTITIKMLNWAVPTATIKLQRQDNFYSDTDITVNASFSSVDSKNAITITYKARKTGTSSYTISGTLKNYTASTFTADNNYAWDVVVTIVDKFGGTTTYNLLLSRGLPIIYFDRLKSSVGVNCFPQDDLSLEVYGFNVQRSIMTRSLSSTTTAVSGSYTKIALNLNSSAGGKLTATSDYGIKIGSNVTKILVSGALSITTTATSGNRNLRIAKNSYSAENTLAMGIWTFPGDSGSGIISIPPVLADIEEGDIIYLFYNTVSNDSLLGNANFSRTYLTVECVG